MTIFSTLRAAHYLARDVLPALRRLVTPPDDDSADAYAEHLARVRAEMIAGAAGRQAGRDFAAELADREAQTEVSEPQEDCGLGGEADECLCDRACDDGCRDVPIADIAAAGLAETMGVASIFRSGGQIYEMGPRPRLSVAQPPSAADEPAFTEWLARLDERLAAIQDQLTSAAPGAILPPDAAPESPAPDPGAGAGHPDISNFDWALVFVGLEHLARLSNNPDQWKALSDRISDALARSK